MNIKILLKTVVLTYFFVLYGCGDSPRIGSFKISSEVYANYIEEPVRIDGILNEQAWKGAKDYFLDISKDSYNAGDNLVEEGEVKLCWDDVNLYIGVQYQDRDVLAEGRFDELIHCKLGDVCEIFLKPNNKEWYWEIFSTPNGNKSEFFWLKPGFQGSYNNSKLSIKSASHIKGTLNQVNDLDLWWSSEIAIPLEVLSANGETEKISSGWRILIARQNYTKEVKPGKRELSSFPQLKKSAFHSIDEYAYLRLVQ